MKHEYRRVYCNKYIITSSIRVSDDLDKREGSIIYDALAPAAWEMASIYRLLFSAYDEAFISTATGVSLDRRVEEMGITRRDATKAVCKGEFKILPEVILISLLETVFRLLIPIWRLHMWR